MEYIFWFWGLGVAHFPLKKCMHLFHQNLGVAPDKYAEICVFQIMNPISMFMQD